MMLLIGGLLGLPQFSCALIFFCAKTCRLNGRMLARWESNCRSVWLSLITKVFYSCFVWFHYLSTYVDCFRHPFHSTVPRSVHVLNCWFQWKLRCTERVFCTHLNVKRKTSASLSPLKRREQQRRNKREQAWWKVRRKVLLSRTRRRCLEHLLLFGVMVPLLFVVVY